MWCRRDARRHPTSAPKLLISFKFPVAGINELPRNLPQSPRERDHLGGVKVAPIGLVFLRCVSDAWGLPTWQFNRKDLMTINFGASVFEFTGSSLFVRLGGLEVFANRPHKQPLGMTSMVRSGATVEAWAMGFYGCVCREM